ncbi:hypothetical protein BI308_10590 [Roseofilum reptotaenium AO1-A]|uniref:Uncharacterized protein n=1 Tax=Roseofilum reptotaenium AO1-A TaxID=1925591 RepID=A0A1L9QSG1_9CYAN|nr:hypothetical protein BI308_10590 [Roseofilum reptotaenium AO1-A]
MVFQPEILLTSDDIQKWVNFSILPMGCPKVNYPLPIIWVLCLFFIYLEDNLWKAICIRRAIACFILLTADL